MGRLLGTTTTYSFLPNTPFSNSYTYDADSNRTRFTAPDGSTNTYSYDTLNRLSTLANSWAGSFGFGGVYPAGRGDALSRRTQMTRPNNVTTKYTYDNLSRLLSVLHRGRPARAHGKCIPGPPARAASACAGAGSTIDGATYTVDAAGNRTAKTDNRANVTSNYTYDAIYELTGVTQGSNTTESYTYDPVGNRLSSLGVSPYSYNSSNELTSTSAASYAYDYNGNTTSKTVSGNTTNYTWDYENRLASVVLPGTGGTATFKYDPFGRRAQKVFTQNSTTTTTNYVYDRNDSVEEIDQNGNVLARYSRTTNIDEPLAESRSGTTSYYDADGLGSVTSLGSTAGVLVATSTFDSFGNLTNSSGSLTNPFRYTAHEFDGETNLYFYRARYYDPSVGRFMSEDPTEFQAGVDFYKYVFNRSTMLKDPFGLDALLCYYPEGPGHVGFGVSGESGTQGFYPLYDSNSPWYRQPRRLYGPGTIKPDPGGEQHFCILIPTDHNQDYCLRNCRKQWADNPGNYNVATRQCTTFVRNCFKSCGIYVGSYAGPYPGMFANSVAIAND